MIKHHVFDFLKIKGNLMTKVLKNQEEYVTFKCYERKIKSSSIIYAVFESIFMTKNNRKRSRQSFKKYLRLILVFT